MTPGASASQPVFAAGRDPEVLLPVRGQHIAVFFRDCCVDGEVAGVVASAAYDEDDWPKSRVRFEDGSEVRGFDVWRVLPERPLTTAAFAERLAQLKRTNVPRLTVERLASVADEFAWEDIAAAHVPYLDACLRGFAFLTDQEGQMLCPGCSTPGWPIGKNADHCACGWPCVTGLVLRDLSPDAPCARCGKVKHVAVDRSLGPDLTRIDYLCTPVGTSPVKTYLAPVLLELFPETALWAHPYDVRSR